MIEINHIEFGYQSDVVSLALDDVCVNIKKGEFVAVLGHNGCGKSTLAKHMNGILLPQGGSVFVNGMDTRDESLLWKVRQAVGMVFQNPDNQIVATVVEEDAAFGPENLGVASEEIKERVEFALKAVGMLEHRNAAPHMLSGGQKQRVAIAGIIAMLPGCIVLDEPTAMLDPRGRKEVMQTILQLNREMGITMVLITHYMDEAAQADRVLVMDKGKIMVDNTPRMVFSNVALLKSIGLDVPQVTDLMFSLRAAGIYMRYDLLTIDECFREIMLKLPLPIERTVK